MNHSHVLYDSDPHFRIDPISRNIINTSSTKTRLIQYDHNSERFTFEIPRHIEGHDMVECNLVEIHYSIVEANTKIVRGGVYTVDDLQEKDETTVVCSWLVKNNATQFVGQLQFLIRFSCVNETTGKLEYVWNTSIYNAISISSGIYNLDSPSDNTVPPFNFVTTVSGQILKFFVGTKAEYEELQASGNLLDNCIYYITDDASADTDRLLRELSAYVDGLKDGSISVKSLKINNTEDFRFSTFLNGTMSVAKGVIPYNILYFAMFVDDTGCAYTGMFTNIDVQDGMSCFGSLGGAKLEYIQDLGSMYITNENGDNLSGYLVLRKVADMR